MTLLPVRDGRYPMSNTISFCSRLGRSPFDTAGLSFGPKFQTEGQGGGSDIANTGVLLQVLHEAARVVNINRRCHYMYIERHSSPASKKSTGTP